MVNSTRAAELALANNSSNEMDIVINQGYANVLRYKHPLKKTSRQLQRLRITARSRDSGCPLPSLFVT